ncbi:hypothetical protein TSH7_22130 [Azospirillum sp. TSH7]|uniref:hypothetical protein n=1 Tax=unclassified Azospirillum TaxID=2630922 RepID=UPI000D618855|nr:MULTISPECIES: hypothetical protein [unclassified Azospirillum]PWC58913.1 hypothetical protein TSH7_22130 [Azospirillum sp. TSH7]PWC60370.1 hypothetical protein TSH20_25345 [Azospirillum sp. TSH20]
MRFWNASWISPALTIVLAGLLIGAPLLVLNGFPLTFDDTPGYLEPAFNILHRAAQPAWTPPPDQSPHGPASANIFFLRPFGYMLFLLPFASGWGVWLIPLAQGILAAAVLRAALTAAGAPDRPGIFLGIAAVLGLATSLSLHAATIMPDFLTGLLILLVYVVVVRWQALSMAQRSLTVAALTGMIVSHLSHLAILGGMVVLLALWALWKDRGILRPLALGVLLPVALAAGLLTTSNLLTAGRMVLSESSPVFLLARLIGDGPARDYLAEACRTHDYLLCGSLDTLGRSAPGYVASDYFLWHPNGARRRFGDQPRFVAEAAEIAHNTIASRPAAVAEHGLANAVSQFLKVQSDDTLNDPVKPLTRRLFSRFPAAVYAAFDHSLQTQQRFPRSGLALVEDLSLSLGVLGLATMGLGRWRRVGDRVRMLLLVIGLGLVLNAIVTGGLSAVHDRYQNRVIWLVPFAALVLLATARSRDALPAERTGRTGPGQSTGWNTPPGMGTGTPVVAGRLSGSPSRLRTAR